MTKPRFVPLLLAGLFALGTLACDDVPEVGPPDQPAAQFWDNRFHFLATSVETGAGATLPLPTDFAYVERLRVGEDGGPPVADVLEGAVATFELDGRLLVTPAGAETLEDVSTNYQVLDAYRLELSVHHSIWFLHDYAFDTTSDTLLVQSEHAGGVASTAFVFDVIERTLFSGSLDSAASRIDALLFEDPRVQSADDAFLFALLHGEIPSIPIRDEADATRWMIGVLRQTGVAGTEQSNDELEGAVAPIVTEALGLESVGLAGTVLARLLASGAVTEVISEDRAERVLRFALYRRMLETNPELVSVGRVDLLFESVETPRAW